MRQGRVLYDAVSYCNNAPDRTERAHSLQAGIARAWLIAYEKSAYLRTEQWSEEYALFIASCICHCRCSLSRSPCRLLVSNGLNTSPIRKFSLSMWPWPWPFCRKSSVGHTRRNIPPCLKLLLPFSLDLWVRTGRTDTWHHCVIRLPIGKAYNNITLQGVVCHS